jgi:hypothetical protein
VVMSRFRGGRQLFIGGSDLCLVHSASLGAGINRIIINPVLLSPFTHPNLLRSPSSSFLSGRILPTPILHEFPGRHRQVGAWHYKRGRRGRPCWCGCLLLPFPSPARAGQGGATHNSLTSPSHPESPHRPHVGSPRSDAGEQGVEDRVRSSPTPSPFLRTSATGEGDKHVSGHQLLVLRLPAP